MNKKNEFIPPQLTVEELSEALFTTNLKLEQTNQTLLKAQKERLEFFSNLSHDLRSPITALHSSMDYLALLLRDDTKDPEVFDTLNLMEKRMSYLEKIVNDIFLLSSLDASLKQFHYEEVPISCFLEDFYYSCEADSKYHNRQLSLKVPYLPGCMVHVDTHMLSRVLDNLFCNALKYSNDHDSICLSLEKISDSVCISVSDSGIGIAPENVERIFERTFQESDARTPGSQSGCGLGLSIVKLIVEQMGGHINCKSTLQKGSTFSFTLPLLSSAFDQS